MNSFNKTFGKTIVAIMFNGPKNLLIWVRYFFQLAIDAIEDVNRLIDFDNMSYNKKNYD